MAAGPIEAVLARYEYASVVAVYAVPDTHAGDQVMAASSWSTGKARPCRLRRLAGRPARPRGEVGARYVRVTAVIPATATGK